jgi:hypothetical protein
MWYNTKNQGVGISLLSVGKFIQKSFGKITPEIKIQ